MPLNQQVHLFHAHIQHLRKKHYDNLLQLFEKHAPALDTKFKSLPVADIVTSASANKLGLNVDGVESEFTRWQRERGTQARTAFDEMLGENAFVEFWGRLGKIGGEGVEGGVKAEDTEGDDGEAGGGKVDMKQLAKQVDVQEIVRVIAVSCLSGLKFLLDKSFLAERETVPSFRPCSGTARAVDSGMVFLLIIWLTG